MAVLDRTTNALLTIHGEQGKPSSTTLPLTGPGALAPHTDGRSVPVTVADNRHVFVVDDTGVVKGDFAVPGAGTDLQPAVAWQGYFYVADGATGTVHVFDGAGAPQKGIGFTKPGGPIELEVREGYLFINAPGSSTARVVDDLHGVRSVDKYADDVLGWRPAAGAAHPADPAPAAETAQAGGEQAERAAQRAGRGRQRRGPGDLAGGRAQRRDHHPVRGGRRRADLPGGRRPAAR